MDFRLQANKRDIRIQHGPLRKMVATGVNFSFKQLLAAFMRGVVNTGEMTGMFEFAKFPFLPNFRFCQNSDFAKIPISEKIRFGKKSKFAKIPTMPKFRFRQNTNFAKTPISQKLRFCQNFGFAKIPIQPKFRFPKNSDFAKIPILPNVRFCQKINFDQLYFSFQNVSYTRKVMINGAGMVATVRLRKSTSKNLIGREGGNRSMQLIRCARSCGSVISVSIQSTKSVHRRHPTAGKPVARRVFHIAVS